MDLVRLSVNSKRNRYNAYGIAYTMLLLDDGILIMYYSSGKLIERLYSKGDIE